MENTQWLQKKTYLIQNNNKGIVRSLQIPLSLMQPKVHNQEDLFQVTGTPIDKNLIIRCQLEIRLCRKNIQIKFLDSMKIMMCRVLIVNPEVLCQEEVNKVQL